MEVNSIGRFPDLKQREFDSLDSWGTSGCKLNMQFFIIILEASKNLATVYNLRVTHNMALQRSAKTVSRCSTEN